ncbi:Transcription factor TFIIIB component B [Tulasnella sp. 403]|nr:Transcription factor TFIIIB component B [Tulasnella sp. 403]
MPPSHISNSSSLPTRIIPTRGQRIFPTRTTDSTLPQGSGSVLAKSGIAISPPIIRSSATASPSNGSPAHPQRAGDINPESVLAPGEKQSAYSESGKNTSNSVEPNQKKPARRVQRIVPPTRRPNPTENEDLHSQQSTLRKSREKTVDEVSIPVDEAGAEPSPETDEDPDYESQSAKTRSRKGGKRKTQRKSAPSTRPEDRTAPEDDEDEIPQPRKPRKRRRTALDLMPAEEIPMDEDGEPVIMDPGTVTMAELCVDMGVGRPSSRTEESILKAAEWKTKQKLIRQQVRERHKNQFRINRIGEENPEGGAEGPGPVDNPSQGDTQGEMIAHLMPGRTRREVRNKYNAEMKKDPIRMDVAFNHRIPVDLEELSKTTGLDFSGPAPEFPALDKTTIRPSTAPVVEDEGEEINISHIRDESPEGEEQRQDTMLFVPRDSFSPPPLEEVVNSMRNVPTAAPGAPSGNITGPTGISVPSRSGRVQPSSAGQESLRASPISAISVPHSQATAGKGSAKGKEKEKSSKGKQKQKRGKKRGISLADDEELIGTVE